MTFWHIQNAKCVVGQNFEIKIAHFEVHELIVIINSNVYQIQ